MDFEERKLHVCLEKYTSTSLFLNDPMPNIKQYEFQKCAIRIKGK